MSMSMGDRLWEACGHDGDSWSMLVVGEDHVAEMRRLVLDLANERPSTTGDGRFISSGHAYWGVGPTISWHRACKDPSYLVGRRSVESFTRRWNAVADAAGTDLPATYVSLGPGTGEKDIEIVRSLGPSAEERCYIPVDMSAEMLRLHREDHSNEDESLRHMVCVKLDFSVPENVEALRGFLDEIVGPDTPILFSLLGNTLANFQHDEQTLSSLVELLTHDDDMFLLEVATSSKIDQPSSKRAAMEYRGSPLFLSWVTSALMTHTDMAIDLESVKFLPSIEDERALVLKVVYVNTASGAMKVTVADGSSFSFQPQETIRVDLTRKYHPDAVSHLLEAAHLSVAARHKTRAGEVGQRSFGLELLLAQRKRDAETEEGKPSLPDIHVFAERDR